MGENEFYMEEVADNDFLNNVKDNNLCNFFLSNPKYGDIFQLVSPDKVEGLL